MNEISTFLKVLNQVVYTFKAEISGILDTVLTPLLQRIFTALALTPSGTDDLNQLRDLRREYLNFINVVLNNGLSAVFVSEANQSTFETIITSIDTFARDADQPDLKRKQSIFKTAGRFLGLPMAESNPRKLLKRSRVPLGNLPLELLNHLSAYMKTLFDNGTYNIYQLTVSAPAQHFFFNRQDKVGHKIFTIDYTTTIEIEGGATLTLHGNGQNGKMITNFAKLVVPEVAPAPQPYNGQFIQLDVTKVIEAK